MRVLLTGAFPWAVDQLDALKNLGYEILYVEREDSVLSDDEKSADIVICNWLFVHHNIEEFKNLKYIQLLSAGLDRVPCNYVNEHNIQMWNARGVYSIPMAEFVISGVLQILKASRYFYKNQMAAKWEKNRDLLELSDMKVLIVGAGSVGTEIAKRFGAFTSYVRGVDLISQNVPYFDEVVSIERLHSELNIADIVVVTLPLTSETRHLFNVDRFKEMKKNSIFVNVARGGLVDECALLEALNDKLRGAVLDVFEEEPLPDTSDFWRRENVILTPHNSFVSNANNKRLWNLIYQNMKNLSCKNVT